MNINVEIKKLKKKTVSLEIDNRGNLIIRMPINLKKETLDKVIEKRIDWIIQNVNIIKEKNSDLINREYKEGEEVYYLGNKYVLKYSGFNKINDDKTISLKGESAKEELIALYKQSAYDYIEERVKVFSKYFAIKYKQIKIRDQKRRWGSCSFDNKLFFNYKIIMARDEIIDYLVVHEMCHMIHKNHSKEFWNLVSNIMSNAKNLKTELKQISYMLDI